MRLVIELTDEEERQLLTPLLGAVAALEERVEWLEAEGTGPKGAALWRGFDMSYWQGEPVDYAALCANMDFGYVRGGYGLGSDSRFAKNWAGLKGRVKRGVYLYFFARPVDPVKQVQKLWERVRDDPPELPVALDLEKNGNEPYPGVTYGEDVLAALGEVERLFGQAGVIYTSPNHATTYLKGDRRFEQVRLWIANPGGGAPTVPLPWIPGGWWMWQYTWTARSALYGIPQVGAGKGAAGIDLNVMQEGGEG